MELSLELEAGEVEPYPQKGSQRFFFFTVENMRHTSNKSEKNPWCTVKKLTQNNDVEKKK